MVLKVACDCDQVLLALKGEPKVRGFCHCADCRDFLKVPYHSVTAWEEEQISILKGKDSLRSYQHPRKRMSRVYCSHCGDTLYNTNAQNWKIVSQLLIKKCHKGELSKGLESKSHFFYQQRVVDVNDDLPKRP